MSNVKTAIIVSVPVGICVALVMTLLLPGLPQVGISAGTAAAAAAAVVVVLRRRRCH